MEKKNLIIILPCRFSIQFSIGISHHSTQNTCHHPQASNDSQREVVGDENGRSDDEGISLGDDHADGEGIENSVTENLAYSNMIHIDAFKYILEAWLDVIILADLKFSDDIKHHSRIILNKFLECHIGGSQLPNRKWTKRKKA